MAQRSALLQLLASQPLKELHHRRSDGTRQIDELYAACSSSGLIASPANDVRSRYECVFDVALSASFGVWLIDYVEEVCGDTTLLSNDPAEAQLLDGEFVRAWCEKALHGIEAGVVAALKSEQLFQQYLAKQLHREQGKVAVLLSVLQALQRIRSTAFSDRRASTSRHGVDEELKQAELLQRCFQVMGWCARRGLQDQPHTGRFASVPDWMRQVHRRRDKAPPGWTLFLDDVLQALHIGGAYPFSSLQNMLYMLFITIRDTGTAIWESKLSLLLYYLLDLDYLQPGQQQDFCSAFSVSTAQVACWQSMFLLDCVEPLHPGQTTDTQAESAALLSQACELLSSSGQGVVAFKVIQALVTLGRADVALSLHWAHAASKPGPATATTELSQAMTLLDLRLRCGLLVEAFLALRTHCHSLVEPQRTQHAQALVEHLLEWASQQQQQQQDCSGQSALQVLCELPWDPVEEDALVSWLTKQLQAGKPPGDLLPLFFLGKGQVTEALGAYNHWQLHGQSSRGQSARSAALQQPMDALVNAAAAMLPLPQRNVCIAEGAGSADARWPARLLIGLSLQADSNVPVLQSAVQAGSTPPFMSSCFPAQPSAPVKTSAASEEAAQGAGEPEPQQAQVNGFAAGQHSHNDDHGGMAVDEVPGPSLFTLPHAPAGGWAGSSMFDGTYTRSAAAQPEVPLLFGQQGRHGTVEQRDPKRARTQSDAGR